MTPNCAQSHVIGVVVTALAIMTTGWLWLNPVISLLIVAIVLITIF